MKPSCVQYRSKTTLHMMLFLAGLQADLRPPKIISFDEAIMNRFMVASFPLKAIIF